MLDKRSVVLVKDEVTYNTDPVPSPCTNASPHRGCQVGIRRREDVPAKAGAPFARAAQAALCWRIDQDRPARSS
jgi:hypothetical protein